MQFQGEGVEPLVYVCEFEINNYGGFWLLNESNLKCCVCFALFFLTSPFTVNYLTLDTVAGCDLKFSLFQDLRVFYSRSTNHVKMDFRDLAGQTAWQNAAPTSAQTRKGRRKVEYLETLRKYSLADFLLNLNLVNCVGFKISCDCSFLFFSVGCFIPFFTKAAP